MQCTRCNTTMNPGDLACPNCGATVASSGGAAVAAIPSSGLSNNTAAALSYLTFVPAIIFLVMEPYNKVKFIRFHAFQCIGLTVAAIVVHTVAMLIPVIGWVLTPFISLAFLGIWLYAIMKASKGEWLKLPIIGPFAEKQANNG